jgi:hypothetical protein
MVFQTDYTYHIGRAYKGAVARPGEPTKVDLGIAGEDLKPGDAVVFDAAAAERDFKKPVAATLDDVVGMVLYDEGMVPNASGEVIIKSGDPVRVATKGGFYAEAGTDMSYGTQCAWNVTDGVWDALTEPATYALAHRNPAFCGERFVSDGALFILEFEGRIR